MNYDVFISYSSTDFFVANAACSKLEAKGVKCWIAPRDLQPGKAMTESITEAINICKVMLLILSNESNISNQVAQEVDLAVNKNITIVPFRIDNIQPSKFLEFYLRNIQCIDAFSEPREHEMDLLYHFIKGILVGSNLNYLNRQTVEAVNNELEKHEAALPSMKSKDNGGQKLKHGTPLAIVISAIFMLIILSASILYIKLAHKPEEVVNEEIVKEGIAKEVSVKDLDAIIFGDKDESDKFRGKISFRSSFPNNENVIKLIPQTKVIILLDYPGSVKRSLRVEQLFEGMFNKDSNYINVKNKDGQTLIVIHGESKEKLLSILDKIQTSDLVGEKYVKY